MSRVFKAYNVFIDTQNCITIKNQIEDGNTALDPRIVSKLPQSTAPSAEEWERASVKILDEANTKALSIENEALKKAQEMLEAAKKEAEEIISGARSEAEAIRNSSREEGYRQGYSNAREEVISRYSSYFDELDNIIRDLNERKDRLFNEMEPDIISLVFEIAEKVLSYELNRDDKAYESIIRKALSSVRDTDRSVLYIHADGEVAASGIKKNPPPNMEWCRDMDIVINPSMNKGDCILETSWGSIDTGIATQLEQIKKSFEELLDV